MGSWAEDLWRRLDAFDFLNQAMLLAATLLLCAVPFMLITSALAGRSAVSGLSLRLGLNGQAAADMGDLFTSGAATSAAVTGLSWVFFVLSGLAVAGSLQKLYQQMFQLRPRGARDRLRAVVWLAAVVGWTALGTTAGTSFHQRAPVLWWIINVPAFIGFWWFTMWLLLAGRVAWRRLLPCAVATGSFWIGMLIVFHFVFSGMVTGYDEKYGPIGVVFALMSFFIAIGVVITLGAATGMMWQDRHISFRTALTKMRRSS
ncbi:YhjD/YihY/BrkB family envelope integrity protein [Streptomyces nymphaeiformis]|uniref:Membrane protein n=1 Tax=Streptomyces nymphaeiformis TaxID=2663842 RepID=A0A7W7XBE1_9ACTN|nr:YhjD/YihY/BrkB family envelope integrity protein [Streptomyces nymphaeiformis]MBB4981920.1 membrane protein [Streptomyces nymphaeiformis]